MFVILDTYEACLRPGTRLKRCQLLLKDAFRNIKVPIAPAQGAPAIT